MITGKFTAMVIQKLCSIRKLITVVCLPINRNFSTLFRSQMVMTSFANLSSLSSGLSMVSCLQAVPFSVVTLKLVSPFSRSISLWLSLSAVMLSVKSKFSRVMFYTSLLKMVNEDYRKESLRPIC